MTFFRAFGHFLQRPLMLKKLFVINNTQTASLALLTIVLLMLIYPSVSSANTFAQQKARFVNHCMNDSGESQALCECAFNQWQSKLKPDQEPAAITALDILVTERDPTMEEMFAVQSQMMFYSQGLMACLTGGANGGKDLQALMNGDAETADILNQIQVQSAAGEQAREEKRQAKKAQREASDAQIMQARAQWKQNVNTEINRIGDPLSRDVNQFQTLHQLQCSGPSQQVTSYCDCKWQQIAAFNTGAGERVTRGVAFLIADGRDGDLPFEVTAQERNDIFSGIERLSQGIATACD